MAKKHLPPDESHPRYEEWRRAYERLVETRDYLDSLSHLPESDLELITAHARWSTAHTAYADICKTLKRDA